MINIKCHFPLNYYLARKIRILREGKFIAKIGVNEQLSLPKGPGTYKFRLDYHSSKISLDDAEEQYVILYLKYKHGLVSWDTLLKNSLEAKVVSDVEFEAFGPDYYNEVERKPQLVSIPQKIALGLASVLSLALVYCSVAYLKAAEEQNFVFLMGLIGVFALAGIWLSLNKLYKNQFRNRLWAFAISCLLLLFYMHIPNTHKVGLGILTLITLLLASLGKKQEVK